MLSDAAIRRAKPGAKARRLHDGTGTGLYIEIAVSGSKLWRLYCGTDMRHPTALNQAAKGRFISGAFPA